MEALERAEWFNHRGLPESIEDIPSAEREAAHPCRQEGATLEARLERNGLEKARCDLLPGARNGSPRKVARYQGR